MADPTQKTAPAYNVLLRLAALVAAIPVFWMRSYLDDSALWVFLSAVLYTAPYLLVALWPYGKASAQIGFALGYATGLYIGLTIVFILSGLGFPAERPRPGVSALHTVGWTSIGVVAVAVATWIYNRRKISSGIAAIMITVGLIQPFLAFGVQLLATALLLRR